MEKGFLFGIFVGLICGFAIWCLLWCRNRSHLKDLEKPKEKKSNHKLTEYLEKLESVTTELMEARILAEQASIAKNAFLANISHEIRTPLHTILGSVTLLLNTDLTDKQVVFVRRIKSSTQILLDLIGNVLDLSKIAAGEVILESVSSDILHLSQDCFDVLSARADEKNLEYSIRKPDEPIPRVLCLSLIHI